MNASTFDARNYAAAELPITVFNSPCSTPFTWIPSNHSKFDKPEMIPQKMKSERIEIDTVSSVSCKAGANAVT